jgi:hypothetical protein
VVTVPLASTREAIGAVAELLRTELAGRTSAVTVDVGRPEAAVGGAGPKFNLFLYQVDFDGNLRNRALDRGQPAPLWLVLRYLITAFDSLGETDTIEAQRLLGEGLLALQELNFLEPGVAALVDNPEVLKITFDHADAELLSKVMQGQNERYRMSVAFQVRPVMLAFTSPASQAPLVQTVGPPGAEGVVVIPSLGPVAHAVEPERFEAGQELAISGRDLSSDTVEVLFESTAAVPTEVRQDRVLVTVPGTLSAGAYLIRVAYVLPSGRRFSSNPVLGRLMPTLASANIPNPLGVSGANRFGLLQLAGARLGGPDDSIFVSFYGGGTVALTMEAAGTAAQTSLDVDVPVERAIPAGAYLIILRVNGEQAIQSPGVNWT